MTRRDITPEAVARRYLAGNTITALADFYRVSRGVIERRLATARELFPGLPWDERTPNRADSPTRNYTAMNDGKPGESVLRAGSVVRHKNARR